MPTVRDESPELHFFRHVPDPLPERVASSLQTIETSFFLSALGRFPHALTALVTAIEACLHGAPLHVEERAGLQTLLAAAGDVRPALKNDELFRRTLAPALASKHVDGRQIVEDEKDSPADRLRQLRNRFTHRGFSPRDDDEAVRLYLLAGLPILELCYRELHRYDLTASLLPNFAKHLGIARRVARLADTIENTGSRAYCLASFGHRVRYQFKPTFTSVWEQATLYSGADNWRAWDAQDARRKAADGVFEPYGVFDCPVCDEGFHAVAGLDNDALNTGKIQPLKIFCPDCDFSVRSIAPFLVQVLLEDQLESRREEILRGYGMSKLI